MAVAAAENAELRSQSSTAFAVQKARGKRQLVAVVDRSLAGGTPIAARPRLLAHDFLHLLEIVREQSCLGEPWDQVGPERLLLEHLAKELQTFRLAIVRVHRDRGPELELDHIRRELHGFL